MLSVFPVAAGVATAVQAACTGAMVKSLHNPFIVVLISLCGSILVICAVGWMVQGFGFGRAAMVPWWAWPAGACGALVLLSQPLAAPKLGAATFVGLLVSASVITSVLLDNFGWLGFAVHRAGLWRIVGAIMMVGGVTLVSLF